MMRAPLNLVLATLFASLATHAAVFRCAESDGSVTYQDRACHGGEASGATTIPTEFPPPNEAERARILQREAQLEQRLEQKRERESRELSLRSVAAPAPAAAPEPYVEGYPLYFAPPLHRPIDRPRPPRPRPHASGGLNAARP
jgi:hypothetical protein